MRPRVACLAVAAFLLAAPAAQAGLSVTRHAFAPAIEGKEPVGAATTFPSGVGKLYFFTQLVGTGAPAEVLHVWLYDGREVSIFPIEVSSTPWRTWSVRAVTPEQRGDWTVEVRELGGKVLLSATCRIE